MTFLNDSYFLTIPVKQNSLDYTNLTLSLHAEVVCSSSSSSSNTLLSLIQDKAYIEDVAIKSLSLSHTLKET